MNLTNLFYAFLGGFLPTLIWLWFWLKEDPHPEPRRVLFFTFFAGMLAVPAALLLEEAASRIALSAGLIEKGSLGLFIIFIWAAIEEILKYFAAYQAALKRANFDEPADAIIYLITAALGFAALENTLFLLKTMQSHAVFLSLITGNLRFLGATVLHTVTSATLGASIGFCFFHKEHRRRNLYGGLFLATLLHVFFNFFIIKNSGSQIFQIFSLVWVGAIAIIFVFEKIKRVKN